MSDSKFSNQRDAVNSFVEKAIKSNLLDTVKTLLSAFPKDVDFSSHEVSISFYSVYRGENAEMMAYLFSQGAELKIHQLSQVIEQSPLETFKVIFKHYQKWFEKRLDDGYAPQVKALFEERFELLPFLTKEGFGLTPEILPLTDLVEKWTFHDDDIYAYVFTNVAYTVDDFNALSEDEKQRFILKLSEAKEKVVEAISSSNLKDVIDTPELQNYALKKNNAALLSAILERGNSVTADETCHAVDFLGDAKSFEIAIQRDPFAKNDLGDDGNSFNADRLIGEIFATTCPEIFALATQHVRRLSKIKAGSVERQSLEPIVNAAFIRINDPIILDAFFDILPDGVFADNDMVEIAVKNQIANMHVDDITPFLLKAEEKGVRLDKSFFISCFERFVNYRFDYRKENKRFVYIRQLLELAKERLGGNAYKNLLALSDYQDKSEKQILSSFRKAYYSDNINEKTTVIMMLFILATEPQRIAFLNAMTYKDELNEDIAFQQAMKVWSYDPMAILDLPIKDKIKENIVTALSS